MNGPALDAALHLLNIHIQRRYDADDALTHLEAGELSEIAEIASSTDTAVFMRPGTRMGAFGPMVTDDATLMVQLDSFEDDRLRRGDDMFHRVSTMPPDTMPPMSGVAGIVNRISIGGPIGNDPSLNAEMRQLKRDLRDFEERATTLGVSSGPVTGESFDRYGSSLLVN